MLRWRIVQEEFELAVLPKSDVSTETCFKSATATLNMLAHSCSLNSSNTASASPSSWSNFSSAKGDGGEWKDDDFEIVEVEEDEKEGFDEKKLMIPPSCAPHILKSKSSSKLKMMVKVAGSAAGKAPTLKSWIQDGNWWLSTKSTKRRRRRTRRKAKRKAITEPLPLFNPAKGQRSKGPWRLQF